MRALVGTIALTRLGLRRDRITLPAWIYLLTALIAGTAYSFRSLYPTTTSRLAFGTGLAHNPALIALTGPVFDASSLGGLTAWRIGSLGGVLVGLMSLLTVVRHTRAEEESGRLELARAGVVGRYAPLTAGLLVAVVPNVVLAVLVPTALIFVGLPANGSFALGLAMAAVGLMFAAVAAIAAQLTATARAANGIASTILGVAFLLRALGDSASNNGPTWLSWWSPLGWGQQVRPFAHERWWVFGLAAGFVIVVGAAAYALAGARDFGSGLLPTRPGPAQATPHLGSPLALAWRLQRSALLGWTVSFAVVGAALGAMAEDMANLVNNTSPQLESILQAMGGRSGIVDTFFVAMMGVLSISATAYAVQATLRLRSEEVAQRVEPILVTRVGRIRWAGSHLAFAVVGPAIMLVTAGLTMGLADGLRTGDIGDVLPRALAGALVQVPATWVVVGIAIALFGALPRLTAVSWAILVLFLLLGQFGPIMRLDQWAMDVSPFTHVPKIPGGTLTATPLVGLIVVACGLGAVGLVCFRRRDIG